MASPWGNTSVPQPAPHPHHPRLRNKYDVLSTAHLNLEWRLLVDGAPASTPSSSGAGESGARI